MNEDIDSFLSALAEMSDDYLMCRAMRHNWNLQDDFRVVDSDRETGRRPIAGESRFAERRLACTRCGMTRRDDYRMSSFRGHTTLVKLGSSYSPPEHYYVKGAGRMGSELVLGLQFERTIQKVRPSRARKRP